jgi:hypothetical protein
MDDVAEMTQQTATTSAPADLGRRQFLRRAAVAGSLVWAVPTIVSLDSAGAAALLHSSPPEPANPPVEAVAAPPARPAVVTKGTGPAELAFTGDNTLVEFGVGLAGIAAGAMLLHSNTEAQRLALNAGSRPPTTHDR